MENFKVYNCSAGSGKTYSLVREYLLLALGGEAYVRAKNGEGGGGFYPGYFKHILAITFTVKAANEMKERILLALSELGSGNLKRFGSMQAELCTALNVTPEILQLRAAQVHHTILHSYAEFSVSTIDKFVIRLVNSFSRDLNLASDAGTELNTDLILREAINNLIAEAGSNQALTEFIVAFLRERLDEEQNTYIERELLDTGKELFSEKALEAVQSLKSFNLQRFGELRSAIAEKRKSLVKQFKTVEKEVASIIAGAESDLVQGDRGIPAMLRKMAASTYVDSFSWVKKMVEAGKCFKSAAYDDRNRRLIEVLTPFFEQQSSFIFLSRITKNLPSIALLWEINRSIEAWKSENNLIPMSEYNRLLSAEVSGQAAPYVYERIGSWYLHFLIDEFQDTSVLQWNNLLPLILESLSTGNQTVLVGDGKQSIYRWRGGNPALFRELSALGDGAKRVDYLPLAEAFQGIQLENNFRSKRNIVDFNNQLFIEAGNRFVGKQSIEAVYAQTGVYQKTSEHQLGGYLEFQFYKFEEVSAEEKTEFFIERTIEKVYALLEEGIQPGDITVLVSKNRHGSALAARMMKEQWNVISEDSLWLGNHKPVQCIVNWLRLMVMPQLERSRFEILQFARTNAGLNIDTQTMIELSKRTTSFEKFAEVAIPGKSLDLIRMSSVYDFVEQILGTYQLAEKPDPFIVGFVDLVKEQTTAARGTFRKFLDYWDESGYKTSVDLPKGINAIQILTIHKAKGLEFPVVILPFANTSFTENLNRQTVWTERPIEFLETGLDPSLIPPVWLSKVSKTELEGTSLQPVLDHETEARNLDKLNELYVALTRPVDRLYVFASIKRDESKLKSNEKFEELLYLFLNENQFNRIEKEEEVVFTIGEETPLSHPFNAKKSAELLQDQTFQFGKSGETAKFVGTGIFNQAQAAGTELHEVMALCRKPSDLLPIWKSMHGEPTELVLKMHAWMQTEGAKFFDPSSKCYPELSLMDDDKSTFRIDRLVQDSNGWHLLELKTGDRRPEHQKQVETYTKLLAKTGIQLTSSTILYLNELV